MASRHQIELLSSSNQFSSLFTQASILFPEKSWIRLIADSHVQYSMLDALKFISSLMRAPPLIGGSWQLALDPASLSPPPPPPLPWCPRKVWP